MKNFKSYKYEKHSREICYIDPLQFTHYQNKKYISRELSAETVKTTEAAETTTNLESRETRGERGLENQTTPSPGR